MKTVAIVSNHPNQKNNKKFIDQCDEVVRFSTCVGVDNRTGSKTTIWVTRTYYWHTKNVELRHHKQMKRCVKDCHTAYIMYGYPKHDNMGRGIDDGILEYDDNVVHNLCPNHTGIKCVPVNTYKAALLHPTQHPSTGFLFLKTIVDAQLFQDHKIFLFGFTFASVHKSHTPQWEEKYIDDWVSSGYFQRA